MGAVLDVGGQVTLTDSRLAHSTALTRFAYLLTGDPQLVEDLVQDAFLAMHRRFGETIALDHPVAYARRAIVNGHVSRARRLASTETVTDAVPEKALEPTDSAEQDAMWRVLGTLPPRQRAVLVLRYYLDLPDVEIAQAMDCRAGTVRSVAARAFAALRHDPAFASDAAREQR